MVNQVRRHGNTAVNTRAKLDRYISFSQILAAGLVVHVAYDPSENSLAPKTRAYYHDNEITDEFQFANWTDPNERAQTDSPIPTRRANHQARQRQEAAYRAALNRYGSLLLSLSQRGYRATRAPGTNQRTERSSHTKRAGRAG